MSDSKKVQNEKVKTPEAAPAPAPQKQKEVNGPKGPEPTRYGDWERKGIVSDF